MATLKSVIDYVDEIKPNAFSNEAKTKWLNECEGLVQTEVLLWASEEIITYQYDADKDKELLAQPPQCGAVCLLQRLQQAPGALTGTYHDRAAVAIVAGVQQVAPQLAVGLLVLRLQQGTKAQAGWRNSHHGMPERKNPPACRAAPSLALTSLSAAR